MKPIYLYILLAAFASSCSRANFRISVSRPANIAVPEQVRTWVVINNVSDNNSPDELLKKALGGQLPNGNILASEQVVTGLLRSFDESGNFRGVVLKSIPVRHTNQSVDWMMVDSICKLHEAQGIIEVMTFRSQAPVGGVVLDNIMGNSSSSLSGTAVFNFYLQGRNSALERLESSGFYTIPISGNLNPISILNDVMRKKEYYGALGFSIGKQMGSRFIPTWHWVDRQYYRKGSDELKRARNLIRSGHWDLAEQTLEPALQHYKSKARGRAMFNMALVYEGQGKLKKAIDMAENCAIRGGIRPVYEYINVLKRRLNQQSQIYFP